jgi:CheY-like chemotaxis protein
MVAVTDTGIGMSPETKAMAFEPFFTTKNAGEGSGMGLSMVFGFVKQSGGHIEIYSEEGEGTTVKLYFRRSTSTASTPEPSRSEPLVGGEAAILLLEDDDSVRGALAKSLSRLGYSVLEAASGSEALEWITDKRQSPDLILADVVLPGQSGPEVVAQLIEHLPDCKVLYMSGYTENAIVHHGRLDEGVEFIQKPYTQESLASKLREVLAK